MSRRSEDVLQNLAAASFFVSTGLVAFLRSESSTKLGETKCLPRSSYLGATVIVLAFVALYTAQIRVEMQNTQTLIAVTAPRRHAISVKPGSAYSANSVGTDVRWTLYKTTSR